MQMQAQTINLELDRPFPWQRQVMRECRRFNVVAVGRRAGKSTMSYELMLRPALAGLPVGYFAPTYKLLGETWRAMRRLVAPIAKSTNASDHRIELLTGGVIEMWTLEDANAGRSRKYKRVVIDEAGLCPDLGERWHEAILPTLADYEGDAWLLGTPKGRNFFWRCWGWGHDPLKPDWVSWQMPTTVNPTIKATEIAMLRESMPEMSYQQEIEAAFLEAAGGVFRKVREAATCAIVAPYPGEFVMGVDWGQQHDFTVLTVMDRATRRMVDWQRFNQIDWALQRKHLVTMAQRWEISSIVAERNSIGSPNIEALQRDNLPVIAFDTTAVSKPPLIESLVLAFERSQIGILNNEVLIGELEAYERTVSDVTGRSRYGAPEGQHDDCVISLALALHAAEESGVNFRWID
jgi:hypothetical protein